MNIGASPLEKHEDFKPNQKWLDKCAYFFYKARLAWEVEENKDQDMEWAKQVAMQHRDRSSQSEWTPEDDKLVETEMAHQASWNALKRLKPSE